MRSLSLFIVLLGLIVFSLPAGGQSIEESEFSQAGNNYTCYQWNKPRNWGSMKPIDNSKLTVLYDYTFCVEADSTGKKLRDSYRLQIGDSINRYYSEYSQRVDSIAFNYILSLKQEYIDQLVPDWTPSRLKRTLYSWIPEGICPLYYDVYTFNATAERRVSSRFQYIEYQYTEPQDELAWEMIPGSENILGFECNKAMASYRGRTWIVSFTFDLPYPAGPWKLGGLPGLILKAEDAQGLFKWEASGITQEEDEPIFEFVDGYSTDKRIYVWIPNNKTKKCTRKEVEKMWKRFWNAPRTIQFFSDGEGVFADSEGREHIVRVSDPVPNDYYPRLELDL